MATKTILLGAGASAEAGIPTATGLMQIVNTYCKSHAQGPIARAIGTALGGLQFSRPWAIVDVEALYQVLLGLSARREHYFAPFVGAWHENVMLAERVDTDDAADAMTQALISDLGDAVRSAERRAFRMPSLDGFREAARQALATTAGPAKTFHQAALAVLQIVRTQCWVADNQKEKVQYLVPLLQTSERTSLWIASLNYDNTIELAAEICGVPVDRGIENGARVLKFQEDAKVTVAKLHGSLDWAVRQDGTLEIIEAPHKKNHLPALVFGAGNKLRISGPYLDLLLSFRSRLERSDQLHICGYSFRDAHINYLIYSWLEGDDARHVFVSDSGLLWENLKENYSAALLEAMDEMTGPVRFQPSSNFAPDEHRFTLVQKNAREWVQCVSELS